MGTQYVEQAFAASDYQLASLWDFTIEGADDDSPWSKTMTFQVEDVSLPFPRLVMEEMANGEKYYAGVEFPKDVSLTLRGDLKFTALQYFEKWMALSYNLDTRLFRSSAGKTKGKDPSARYRRGVLSFRSFSDSRSARETIHLKENGREHTTVIIRQEEVDNMLFGVGRNLLTSAQSMVSDPLRTFGVRLPAYRPKVPTMKLLKTGFLAPKMYDRPQSPVDRGGWEERTTYVFTMENLSILGVEDLSLSYTEPSALLLKVDLVAENIKGEPGKD